MIFASSTGYLGLVSAVRSKRPSAGVVEGSRSHGRSTPVSLTSSRILSVRVVWVDIIQERYNTSGYMHSPRYVVTILTDWLGDCYRHEQYLVHGCCYFLKGIEMRISFKICASTLRHCENSVSHGIYSTSQFQAIVFAIFTRFINNRMGVAGIDRQWLVMTGNIKQEKCNLVSVHKMINYNVLSDKRWFACRFIDH